MRAYSTPGLEMDIELTYAELSLLERELIQGKVNIRDRGEFPLNIKRAKTRNLFLDLATEPAEVDYDEVQSYRVMISDLGYERLKQGGEVQDRVLTSGKICLSLQ